MVVSDRVNETGRPLVIHNIGAGVREVDLLFEFQITGRYRIKPGAQYGSANAPDAKFGVPSSFKKPEKAIDPIRYKVGSRGDGGTLSGIARLFYGDANDWRRIYEANQKVLKNPDVIHDGMILSIPTPD
jgi:nucleoid-associated protein YgaU